MVQATSILEVIDRLDSIIAWSRANQSTMGYFAMLYRRMTVAVMEGIHNNQFEDG